MFTSEDTTTKMTGKFVLTWTVMVVTFYVTPIYTLLIRTSV